MSKLKEELKTIESFLSNLSPEDFMNLLKRNGYKEENTTKEEVVKIDSLCPYCYGDGMIFNPHINPQPITCPACDGKGTATEEQIKEFESMIQ